MASYEAIINLVVQGEAALNRIQKKIDNLYKTVGDLETKKKFSGSQAAADFVRQQADELERVVSVSKKQIKEQERSIVKQSKLNAAVDLYERRQRQLSRTSVANQKQFADQIKQIEEGFKFFKERKSATGVQAIATELGRIIEYDNEINRISERRTTNQRRLFAFSKEIARYEAFGLKTDRARKTLSNFEEVAGSNQLKKAQQYEAALRNQLKLLKDQLVEQQRVAKIAPSSPIRGGINFPGSPIAKKEQAKAEKAIAGATGILGGAAQRLIGAENKAELKSAIDEYLGGLSNVQSSAERILTKDAKFLSDFDKRLNERVRSREKAVADAWKMRGGPALPTGFTEAGVIKQKGASVNIGAQRRLQSVLASGSIVEQGLINLRAKGADVSRELIDLQQALNTAKQKDYAISENTLDVLASQVSLAGKFAQLQRTILAGQSGGGRGGKAGPEGTGLEQALAGLQQARGARQAFLGSASPAQAIDQIVREFNKGGPAAGDAAKNITNTFAVNFKKGTSGATASAKSFATAAAQAIKDVFGIASPSRFMIELVQNLINTYIAEMQKSYPKIQAATDKAFGEQTLLRNVKELRATGRGFEFTERPSRGFRPFREAQGFGRGTEGATQEFNNMMLDFRKQIAELTTQPEIFSNLLKALPNSRITTDLVGAANRRALASELPSFMPTQRMMGSGELEKVITSAFADYFRTIRTPNPWIGAVGDYREFINKVVAETKKLDTQQKLLTGARVAGALPPSSREGRIAEAYRRSDERGRAVMAEGAFGAGQISLPSAGPRSLSDSINDLFSRISSAVRGSFGGFGGGGGRPIGGGGAADGGGAPSQVTQLLGFDAIADISRVSTRELEALSAAASELRAVLDPTIEGFDRLDNQLRETIGQIGRQIERRAPEAGFLTRQFGPRTARGISEGLIGGAFPLLFGQGLGAAVGGGAGGFAGGFAGGGLGFGLSLVGTALGTAFDTAVQSATELGAALQKPVENFDKLAEKSFFSSKALENVIEKSIEYGDTATASALIQEEAIKKLGVGGVQNLKNLGTESDRLNRAFAELGQQMQAVAAGPLSSVIGFFADVAGQAAAAGKVRLLRSNLNEQQAGQFNQEILGRLKERGIQRGFFAPSAPTESEIGMLQQQGALQDIVDKFQPLQLKGNIKIDPKQKIESEINAIQKQLETIDISKSIREQFRSAAREQQDLDKQRADLVRSYEESIGNIRKQVEDKIAEERKRNAQLELDIRAATADLELQKLKEANREFRGIFSDTLAGQTTERVLDAVESITQIQNEGAAQRANLELQIQNTAIETEKYKVEVANQVAKLNEETARRVSDINEQVRRRNEEFDQNRFTLEKRIAELQLKNNEILTNQQLDTAKKNVAAAEKAGDQQQAAYAKTIVDIYQAQLDIIKGGQKDISNISAPAKLTGVPTGAVGGGSVGTSGIDQVVNAGTRLQQVFQGVQDQIRSINGESALLGITESLDKQIKQADLLFFEFEQGGGTRSKDLAAQANLIDAITSKLKEQKDATSPLAQKLRELLQFEDGRYKIVNLINQAQAANTQIQTLEDLIAKEEELKVAIQGVAQINGELLEVDKVKLLLAKQGIDLESDKAQVLLNQAAVVDELSARYRQLTVEQQMQQELLDGIAGAFASTVGGALDAAVDKTKNFGDALKELGGDLLQTIGKMLIMQGIAQLLGALGGGAGNPQGIFSSLAGAFGYKFANGGYFANRTAAFANGGMFTNSVVSSPTLFQFADGGALRTGVMGEAGPEAIMPLERGADGKLGVKAKLSGAMGRYRRPPGTAGAAGGAGGVTENGQNGTATMQPIDVRYSVERINNVDYVTADQFQAGMAQAAQQGAIQGERRAMRTLTNSAAARGRLRI